MSKSAKKQPIKQNARKYISDTPIDENQMSSILQGNRLISMMPTFISVLQSMSEFPQIIWGRKRLMNFRKTIMRSLF